MLYVEPSEIGRCDHAHSTEYAFKVHSRVREHSSISTGGCDSHPRNSTTPTHAKGASAL